jgi:hypothetical protein
VYDAKEAEGSVEEAPSRLTDLVVDYEKQAWKIQPTVTGTTSVWGSAGWEQFQHPQQGNRSRVNLEPSKGYANPLDTPKDNNSSSSSNNSSNASTTAASSTSQNRMSGGPSGQGFLNTTAWGSGGQATSLASLASMQGVGLTDPNHPHYASTSRDSGYVSPRTTTNSNRNSESRAPHQMSPHQGGYNDGVGNRGSASAVRPPQNKGFQTKSEREQARNSGLK